MPEIAVVITCYNKADYISKAISSALICTQNVIVVDHQSTDDSWEKISKFEQVEKIREPINMGVTAATTVPGKIAIVYTQNKDAVEYLKYIKYMQSKQLFGNVEKLELEDLQGVR